MPKLCSTDLDFAASELGTRVAGLSQGNRGLALLQFNIENQLMAEDAEKQNLAAGRSFEGWSTYQRRRALRDMYFDKYIRGSSLTKRSRSYTTRKSPKSSESLRYASETS